MLQKLSILFLSLFLLTSRADYIAEQEKDNLERERKSLENKRIADKETCKYYGFKENTDSFADCLMNLDMARKQQILTRKMLECEAVKRDNNQSAATGFWGGVLKGARENLVCS